MRKVVSIMRVGRSQFSFKRYPGQPYPEPKASVIKANNQKQFQRFRNQDQPNALPEDHGFAKIRDEQKNISDRREGLIEKGQHHRVFEESFDAKPVSSDAQLELF